MDDWRLGLKGKPGTIMLEKAWIRENIRQGRYQISEHVIRFLMAGLLTVPEIEAAATDGRVVDMSPPGRRAASLLLKAAVGGKTILVRVSRGAADGMIISLAYLAAAPPWDALRGTFPNENDTMQTVFQRCFLRWRGESHHDRQFRLPVGRAALRDQGYARRFVSAMRREICDRRDGQDHQSSYRNRPVHPYRGSSCTGLYADALI
ncbi:hypothetical protein [Desulfosarcina cetonica]|uniref:hypothetical protein n=1 Tax=Desulfosarcina cetonica TaxID=90730 RepID=UPI001FEDD97B|nr:hypothetical protein [Desulfosarcina cetonica]